MMRIFLSLIFVAFVIFGQIASVRSDEDQNAFTRYMLEWREKSEIAQEYLRKSDQELKTGFKYRVCLNKRLASQYGVQALQALIKAQQYNDTDKQLLNIEENLDRMKRLGNCSTAISLFNN